MQVSWLKDNNAPISLPGKMPVDESTEIVGVQRELGQAASDTVDVAKSIERASRTVAETVEQLSELVGRFKTEEDSQALTVKQTTASHRTD